MFSVKQNIWLAFYFITALWVGFFIFSSYSIFKSTYQEVKTKQQNVTLMAVNSLESSFNKYNVILDVISHSILFTSTSLDPDSIKEHLSPFLDIDRSIISIDILKMNGELYTSTSLDISPILEHEWDNAKTNKSLHSESMILNRTIYKKSTDRIILPISKTIRDNNGTALYMIVLEIDIEKGFLSFVKNNIADKLDDIYLYREEDRYFQIAPTHLIKDANIYNHQISIDEVEKSILRVEKQTGESYKSLKSKGSILSHDIILLERRSIAASMFLQKYDLWVVSEIETDKIYNLIYTKILKFLVLFVFLLIITYYLFNNIDLSQKDKSKMLEYQANHDHFTGLHNRFYLERNFKTIPEKTNFSLLLIAIDDLKTIKDNYGHEIGHAILKLVSLRLNMLMAKNELLIRYRDNEFIIVTFNNNAKEINTYNEQVLNNISKPYCIKEHEFTLNVNIGIADYPFDGTCLDDVLLSANIAMHESKKTGNQIVHFEDKFKVAYLYREKIESELKNALEKNELSLVYQPQIDNNGKIKGIEALIRWNSNVLGFVPPDKFITVAEACGKMPNIGDFVINRALGDMLEIHSECGIELDLSINVSVKQFQHPLFYENLMLAISNHSYNTQYLLLEVTESVFIEDISLITSIMNKLKSQGIRISLDDFGTGYSSLNILKHLPIDELKIDKSFVDDVLTNPTARIMLKSLISLAKQMNIRTVAEGIELEEQLLLLKEMDCDIFQGYLFAKPLSKDKLKCFLLGDRRC